MTAAPAGRRRSRLAAPLALRVHAVEDRHISHSIREKGCWEPFETALFQQFIGVGDSVVDAGANLGYFSVLASALVGEQGRVVAFEPEPRNAALLRDNLALNGFSERCLVYEAALGDGDAEVTLYLHPDNNIVNTTRSMVYVRM